MWIGTDTGIKYITRLHSKMGVCLCIHCSFSTAMAHLHIVIMYTSVRTYFLHFLKNSYMSSLIQEIIDDTYMLYILMHKQKHLHDGFCAHNKYTIYSCKGGWTCFYWPLWFWWHVCNYQRTLFFLHSLLVARCKFQISLLKVAGVCSHETRLPDVDTAGNAFLQP